MSNFINGASLNKITSKRTIVSSQRILDVFSNNLTVSNPVARSSEKVMSIEDLEILEDFGFDTSLNKNTRAPLSSLDVSKLRIKHLVNVLAKEPHEKTSKETEDLRKVLAEVPYFKSYVTKTEKNLNTHDLNDLSKLLTY